MVLSKLLLSEVDFSYLYAFFQFVKRGESTGRSVSNIANIFLRLAEEGNLF